MAEADTGWFIAQLLHKTHTHTITHLALFLFMYFSFTRKWFVLDTRTQAFFLNYNRFVKRGLLPSFLHRILLLHSFFPLLLLWAYDSTLHISPLAAVVHLQNTTIHYPNSRGIFLLSISLRGKKNSSGTLQANKLTPKVSYMWNQDT